MKLFLLTILSLVLSVSSWSQESKERRADNSYRELAFITAGEMYQALIEQGYESTDLYGKVGDSYYFNARYEEALGYYRKMFSKSETISKEYYFRYGQCLRVAGEKREAEKYLGRFYKLAGIDNQNSSRLTGNINTLPSDQKFSLKDAGINSTLADFGTAYYGNDKVLFSSSRDTGLFVRRNDKWSAKPFHKLYMADINSDGLLMNPKKLDGRINSKYHQTTAIVSSDGKTMYFTRNNYSNGKFGKDTDGINHLKIYSASFDGKKWKNIQELSINAEDYSTAHPALSPDEKYLYFVSDRPESLGDSDIFRVEIKQDRSLGKVEHLGDKINTPGKESFPFLDEAGNLYFSSNGHSGFGGLDVFVAIEDSFNRKHILNLDEPINSASDDFSFAIRTNGNGFLSSNRGKPNGLDDIYSIRRNTDPLKLKAVVCGQVLDSITKLPVSATTIELRNTENEILATVKSDTDGNFCIPVWPFEGYNIRTLTKNYQQKELWVAPIADNEKKTVLFELIKDKMEFEVGDDLAKQLDLKPIYFDFDASIIRKVSEIELAKVIAVLKKYPELSLEVHSHTDSRGDQLYNQALSERRAKATVEFIIENGKINPTRILGKGFGESEPIKACGGTEKCSKAAHQLNRRSEFNIIKVN